MPVNTRTRDAIPLETQQTVREEEGEHCGYCAGWSEYLEIDHIMPWSRGGSNERDNLTLACYSCNREKSDMTVAEWQAYRERNGAEWPPPTPLSVMVEMVQSLEEMLADVDMDSLVLTDDTGKFITESFRTRFREGNPSGEDMARRFVDSMMPA